MNIKCTLAIGIFLKDGGHGVIFFRVNDPDGQLVVSGLWFGCCLQHWLLQLNQKRLPSCVLQETFVACLVETHCGKHIA